MPLINDNYLKLKAGTSPQIGRRVAAFTQANPKAPNASFAVGSAMSPNRSQRLAAEAMHRAIDEQRYRATFKGYRPEQGYAFLRGGDRQARLRGSRP